MNAPVASTLTLCTALEDCARAERNSIEGLEQRMKTAMDEGRVEDLQWLVHEYNHETRLRKVAQKRAMRLLEGGRQ